MKFLFTMLTLMTVTFSTAQVSFSDNFDSYANGAYIAASNPKWTTWSAKPGTAEDAKVTNEKARSGAQSLKIVSTSASGGATDLLLPFGGKYTSGHFSFGTALFVPTAKNAYFNIQATPTPGQAWTLDVNFSPQGIITISRSSAPLLTMPYPVNTWFDFQIVVNLTSNIWKVVLNGECVGAFTNAANSSVASIDFFPTDASSLYYLDDVRFSYDPAGAEVALDGSMGDFTWTRGKLAGSTDTPTIALKSNGTKAITDAEISIKTPQETFIEELSGISLTKGQKSTLSLPEVTLVPGKNTIEAKLTKVNGLPVDDETCNNIYIFELDAPVPAPHKGVLVEEGTGTWCAWCPRGAVFMDRYDDFYPSLFIPIAVHNGSTDPMVNAEYNSFMAFTAFPNAKVNRGTELDPSAAEPPFLASIGVPPVAKLTPGARYNPTTRKLDVSVEAEYLANATGDFYMSLILTEDGVKGTSTGYSQANAYAGGGAGPMGGYEGLPNPVPATMMVYNHVARAVSGLRSAPANKFSGPFTAGDKVLLTFSFTLLPTWKIDNMHIIPVLMKGLAYQNATTATVAEATANGFVSGSVDQFIPEADVQVYPNPAGSEVGIYLDLPVAGEVHAGLFGLDGTRIMSRSYGKLEGQVVLPLSTESLQPGFYILDIVTPSGKRLEKIQIVH